MCFLSTFNNFESLLDSFKESLEMADKLGCHFYLFFKPVYLHLFFSIPINNTHAMCS